MIDKESLRKMCEYPITPTLIGEIEPLKETALERAHRLWRMDEPEKQLTALPACAGLKALE
jgi:hypothetical protein